jgi:tetratricopeptide (TPR) repeat protein
MSGEREQAQAYAREAQRLRDAGEHYEALTRQRRAVALLRDTRDQLAIAHALRHLADILIEAGQPEEAGAPVTEMLALYRAAADTPPLDLANALRSAALQAEAIGDIDTAWIFWIQARARYAALDALFEQLTGKPENPGVVEADARLARLRA